PYQYKVGHTLFPTTPTKIIPTLDHELGFSGFPKGAANRIPVEIWECILSFALTWPLLPSEDDELIRNIRLFSHDCENLEEFHRTERTRTKLQLVCSIWNEILKQQSKRLWMGPPSSLSTASSFSRVNSMDARCHTNGGCCLPTWQTIYVIDAASTPLFDCSSTEVIISYDKTLSTDEICQFPNLRLLRMCTDEREGGLPAGLLPIVCNLRHLTHLQLRHLYLPGFRDQPLHLPCLHTLAIEYEIVDGPDDGRKHDYPRFSLWYLPRLINLEIAGRFLGPVPDVEEEMMELLQMVAPTLQGLSFAVTVHLYSISSLPGRSASPFATYNSNEDFLLNLYRARYWAIAEFGMPIGWATLRRQLEKEAIESDSTNPGSKSSHSLATLLHAPKASSRTSEAHCEEYQLTNHDLEWRREPHAENARRKL
ncbi:2852_t:CDS:2, partial [Acaulospora colombiana]